MSRSKTIVGDNRHSALMHCIDLPMCQTRGDVIYAARNTVFRLVDDGRPLSVKYFAKPGLLKRIIYTFLRKSKARRSFDNSRRLLELGIGTPQPVGYREVYRGGLIAESFYVCDHIDNCRDMRWWEDADDSATTLPMLAQFMAKMHRSGVLHRDFSPGNIVYDKNRIFYLLDVNRMRFDVGSPAQLLGNFACINDSEAETRRLARMYAPLSPFADTLGVETIVGVAVGAHRRYVASRRRRSALKRWLHALKRRHKAAKLVSGEQLSLVPTADGTSTIRLEPSGRLYHPMDGAVSSMRRLFTEPIEPLLTESSDEGLTIVEIGFGAGVNAWNVALTATRNVEYHAYETAPLPHSITGPFNLATGTQHHCRRALEFINDAPWGQRMVITPRFILRKHRGNYLDASAKLPKRADVVLFDPFGPDSQPEMWTTDAFMPLVGLLEKGAMLIARHSTPEIVEAMESAGLKVNAAVQSHPDEYDSADSAFGTYAASITIPQPLIAIKP
ncbi:MAG: lipopolysaccharide kinase InaA family protein [Muribaculaceae bacterium]